jgi:cellulose synthase/poly-beta-1,6-N-acetylglucosamine synthase-like glycosyltransferase
MSQSKQIPSTDSAALPDVTIVIPTFRRPDLLQRCLASCLAQKGLGTVAIEVLVIDNSPEGSAELSVCDVARGAAWPVRYVHEPEPGISSARNAGLRCAAGELIAFIDDDEVATEDWLVRLVNTQRHSKADVVFGPVLPSMPQEAAGAGQSPFRDLLTHSAEHTTGVEVSSTILVPFWARGSKAYPKLGAGNFLLQRHSVTVRDVHFDPRLGRTGGEDTLYFNQLLVRGSRFVWCAEAIAWEYVPPERLALRYALLRAFRGGQTMSMTPMLLVPKRPALTILSMMIGLAQVPVYAGLAAFSALMRSPRWPYHLVRAMGAAGKLLWAAPFRVQAYGAGAAKPQLKCNGSA